MTYSWVYNVRDVKDEEKLDGEDYDHQRVMAEINRVNDIDILTFTFGFKIHPIGKGYKRFANLQQLSSIFAFLFPFAMR